MIEFSSYNLLESNSILEIPIYRLNPVSFENELQKELDKKQLPLEEFEKLFGENAKVKYDGNREALEMHIGYLWKFNEIIGWILLNIDGEIFSGELFYKDAKRIRKGSKSKIIYNGKAFKFNIKSEMSDYDIYSRILLELKEQTEKGITKNRYIDTNRFETIGKYMNWKKMFKDLNN